MAKRFTITSNLDLFWFIFMHKHQMTTAGEKRNPMYLCKQREVVGVALTLYRYTMERKISE